MPESRKARAISLTPRSWPSSPIFPSNTRGRWGRSAQRSVFSRGVVGSFVARMLESYAQFSAKQNRSATAAAAFALSASGRSDWAMKMRRHCSMPPRTRSKHPSGSLAAGGSGNPQWVVMAPGMESPGHGSARAASQSVTTTSQGRC